MEAEVDVGVLEPWPDWQIRSMQAAKDAIENNMACAATALCNVRHRFLGHVSRFGTKSREVIHICKAILLWRPYAWWLSQQWYNDVAWDPLFHKARLGHIAAYDRKLPVDWLRAGQDW